MVGAVVGVNDGGDISIDGGIVLVVKDNVIDLNNRSGLVSTAVPISCYGIYLIPHLNSLYGKYSSVGPIDLKSL